MIVRGELTEAHKKRLASLDRPAHVHVMPLGTLSPEGTRLFKEYAKTFKRHRFYLAVRVEQQSPGVLGTLAEAEKLPNVHLWLMKGDISGTESGRWHTRMEKGSAADS